ncbi:MAG: peptide-methionine (S)-S-oxide reductase [Flavobacteriaceae bacterium]
MNGIDKAYLAGGCFWCTEAIYKRLKGVVDVTPGYSGGNIKNPSYKEVCTGRNWTCRNN